MNQTEKMISVIIPVYNGFNYIKNMIDMVNAQTYKHIEVIIVDDGSTDNTLLECRRLTQGNSIFRVLSKENGGVSSARNYGIRESKGDFIAFIDADDYIYPEYLEKLYSLVIQYDADWTQCSFIKVKEHYRLKQYEKMRVNITGGQNEKILIFDKKSALIDLAYRRHIAGSACLKLIKREIAEQIAFREDLRYSEDYTYTLELIKKTNRVVYLDSVEYLYIQRKESAIHIKRNNTLEYRKGWEQLKMIYKEVEKKAPYAQGGVRERCYMQAVKEVSRICDKKADKEYLNELYYFIKQNGKYVFDDNENTIMRRMLGLSGWISPSVTCFICSVMLRNGFMLKKV